MSHVENSFGLNPGTSFVYCFILPYYLGYKVPFLSCVKNSAVVFVVVVIITPRLAIYSVVVVVSVAVDIGGTDGIISVLADEVVNIVIINISIPKSSP